MKRLAVVLIGLLVAVFAVACDSGSTPSGQKASPEAATQTTKTPSPTGSGKRSPIGQPVLISGGENVKVTVTLVAMHTYRTGTGAEAEHPEHGYFVVTTLKISVGATSYRLDPAYCTLISSADDRSYQAFDGHAEHAGYGQVLSARVLGPGQSATGNVVFDAPGQHGVLRYTDPLGGVAEWDV